jgi:hypothetical protein
VGGFIIWERRHILFLYQLEIVHEIYRSTEDENRTLRILS